MDSMSLKTYKSSKWWYADLVEDGQRKTFNLDVEIRGRRPLTLRKRGDADFEASRRAARFAHDQLRDSLHSERQRLRMIERLRSAADLPSMKVEALPGFVKTHLEQNGRNPRYIRESVKVVSNFIGVLPVSTLEKVNASMLHKWWSSLSGSPRTRNKKKQVIQMMFRELIRAGYLDVSPAAALRSIPANTQHREPFTREEITVMMDNAGDLKPLLVVALTTALRLSDAIRLKWEDLNLEEGWVRVKTAKTGAMVDIPLSPLLRDVLPGKIKRSGYVFPQYMEMHKDTVSDQFRRLRERLGISGKKDFHSFRVTWITEALSAGVPMEAVRRVTGHATVDVVIKHYYRPGREQLRKSLERMPDHIHGSDVRTEIAERLAGLSAEQLAQVLRYLKRLKS